jgi:hypothetical protein
MVVLLEAQTPGTWFESIHIDIARVLQALPEQGHMDMDMLWGISKNRKLTNSRKKFMLCKVLTN